MFFLRIRYPLSSPLFPYTTLFRSDQSLLAGFLRCALPSLLGDRLTLFEILLGQVSRFRFERITPFAHRSEEHTSELQSRFDLVCRLLLEKKKNSSTHIGMVIMIIR